MKTLHTLLKETIVRGDYKPFEAISLLYTGAEWETTVEEPTKSLGRAFLKDVLSDKKEKRFTYHSDIESSYCGGDCYFPYNYDVVDTEHNLTYHITHQGTTVSPVNNSMYVTLNWHGTHEYYRYLFDIWKICIYLSEVIHHSSTIDLLTDIYVDKGED